MIKDDKLSLLFEFNGVAKWNSQGDSYDQQAINMTNNLSCMHINLSFVTITSLLLIYNFFFLFVFLTSIELRKKTISSSLNNFLYTVIIIHIDSIHIL